MGSPEPQLSPFPIDFLVHGQNLFLLSSSSKASVKGRMGVARVWERTALALRHLTQLCSLSLEFMCEFYPLTLLPSTPSLSPSSTGFHLFAQTLIIENLLRGVNELKLPPYHSEVLWGS